MDVKSRKAEQSETTRAALIGAARPLFAERGYAGVGTEEIVRAAGVTRGALYHHFDGKRELFRAVYEMVEAELVQRIAQETMSAGDPVEALHAGARAFLDAVEDPAVQRITLLDAPSVLDWEEWREIGMRYGLGLVQATLQAAIDAGSIPSQPVAPMAHLLLGALDEAALLIARSNDVKRARREVGDAIERLLDALVAT
ncbi:MAG TPA: TetR/AcrR family transcriptional regulator [Solirubrobacteraceae bacterium]